MATAQSPMQQDAQQRPQEDWAAATANDGGAPAPTNMNGNGHGLEGSVPPPRSPHGGGEAPGAPVSPSKDRDYHGENGRRMDDEKGDFQGEDKGPKLNKVYIGGLPETTRRQDLESCFGKIGNIVNIELKIGYGFVEFDTKEAASESVAKYNEGFFMGNKIRVEISHGGGKTLKYSGEPGACFKCGQVGHWARECPNSSNSGGSRHGDPPLIDRIESKGYPPRDYGRDDHRGGYSGPPKDRYGSGNGYGGGGGGGYPPRDNRRPPSPPPRDYGRDYPPAGRPPRDFDDYRGSSRAPPPGPPPPSRYESRGGPPAPYGPPDVPPYPPARGYGGPPPPPARDPYDRYDRRAPPPPVRDGGYGGYAGAVSRPRSPPPPVLPPRGRDDYERGPPRDYGPPPDVRGRMTPPPPGRYSDYPPPRGDIPPPPRGYRRRSQSPIGRGPVPAPGYDSAPYPPPGDRFGGNGYAGGPPLGGPPRGGPPRDPYLPPRGARDDAYRRQ